MCIGFVLYWRDSRGEIGARDFKHAVARLCRNQTSHNGVAISLELLERVRLHHVQWGQLESCSSRGDGGRNVRLRFGVITQHGREPALDFAHLHVLAARVLDDLIAAGLSDGEVTGLRM
ncbi:MAG: hypothetical protein V7640_1516 [Betaproteobacteria bacterium]